MNPEPKLNQTPTWPLTTCCVGHSELRLTTRDLCLEDLLDPGSGQPPEPRPKLASEALVDYLKVEVERFVLEPRFTSPLLHP